MRLKNSFFKPNLNLKSSGFTILELLAVITVMVVIASFTIPAMQNSIQRSSQKMGGAQEIIGVFEKARLEAKLKQSYIWVEIERLEGLPERYRFTTWRSPNRMDGRNVEGGGFVIPESSRDKEAWHLRKVGRPKVFEKISLDIELMERDQYFLQDLEFNSEGEARACVVYSPIGVCFLPGLREYHYGAGRVAPNVAPVRVSWGDRTIPVPKAISLVVTQGKGVQASTGYLRISGSTSFATLDTQSLEEEFAF